jgi:hypothetical protein
VLFQYTTPIASETVTNFSMAETKCAQWGGRLFQPRSTVAMAFFAQAEPNHMTEDLFKFSQPPKSSSILAIGLLYQQLAGDSQPYLYYRYVSPRPDLVKLYSAAFPLLSDSSMI